MVVLKFMKRYKLSLLLLELKFFLFFHYSIFNVQVPTLWGYLGLLILPIKFSRLDVDQSSEWSESLPRQVYRNQDGCLGRWFLGLPHYGCVGSPLSGQLGQGSTPGIFLED